MGVHGLWDLLAPVGRRVSVETLGGKRLAIDASIWMVQFMKAMRDEKGEMVRNAHLLGFFRRICKLLFLRTKPVFVFDGGTPALKRRTVIARRRQRENAQAKIRKTAEKLLLNHVKAMRLKMLAEDLKDQKAKNNSKGMEVLVDQSDASGKNDMALEGHNQEAIDEMLVASILAEERGGLFGNASTSAAPIGSDSGNARADVSASVTDFLTQDEDDEDVEEMIRDRAKRLKHLAEDLKDQKDKNYSNSKEVMVDRSDRLEKNNVALEGHKQEMIDKMLAASILAEDCGALDGNASTSASAIGADSGNASASATAFSAEEEDDESDEEMILPVSDGNVDPAVLAALPPSMQLDLLVQMREKLMAENRQKYQKVKKAPKKFSELQIEAYLKTVAFRREIDQVQKAASGRGMAGVQTSRIASETNREFIFSSSFSGDKQLLTSGKAEEIAEKQQRIGKKDSSFDVLNSIGSSTKCNPGAEPTADEPAGDFVNDVQTFLDERGRMRVSRRRAMGIRMTRDLERNIELMKEFEQDRTTAHNLETAPFKLDRNEGASGKFHSEGQSFNAVYELNGDTVPNSTEKSLLEAETHEDDLSQKNGNCIKIYFDDDGENRSLDDDDEFFSKLVAEEPVRISSADKPASDYEREKGIIGKECGNLTNKYHLEVNSFLAEDGNINDTDLEWEEGITCNESGSLTKQNKLEANISHEGDGNNESDVEWEEGTSLISEDFKLGLESFDVEEGSTDFHKDASEFSTNVPKTISKGSSEEEAALQEAIRKSLEDLTDGKTSNLFHELENSGYTCKRLLQREGCSLEPSSQLGSAFHDNELSESFVAGTKEKAQIGNGSSVQTHVAGHNLTDSVHVALGDGVTRTKDASLIRNSSEVPDISVRQGTSIMEEHAFHTEVERNMAEENIALTSVQQRGSNVEISMSKNDDDRTIELTGDSLDDELSALGQEYITLGDEQRKLERNADSVNAEMFVECQELLQMFGLPYIIAPMEAEAQCAYMELANLVDGVVTDDSDVFLFGARSVYKNIFDDRKYVETYFMKDIENELGLNREKLIRMALLLGSDYTEGVSGIGIVNAIEVVNAFPEEDGFHKFREWIESPDPTILGKVAVHPRSSSKKKGSKASKSCKSDSKSNTEGSLTSDCNALHENEDNQAMDGSQKIKKIFMDKHRNVSKNWHIPTSFPSDAVISAYISPQVDRSTDPFAWGKPDIFVLRRLCWEKFGWASQKADELLQPVLKEYNKHETQLRLEAFYTFNERFAKIRSKRIKQAVKGITGKRSLELADADDLQKFPETTKRGKVSTSNKTSKREKSTRKGKDPAESLSSEGGCKGLSSETNRRRLNDAESCKLRGKQMRKAVRRGRRKENPNSTDDETSSPDSDSICDDHGNEVRAEKVEFPDNMRRSKRARKATNYVEKDEESDEPTDTQNVSNQTCSNEAAEHKQSHNQSVTTYAAADISSERESASEDPLSGDVVPGDCAVKGGGFCADEDQPEIPSEDASTRYEKEYLQLGGGFCIDENEEDQDLQEQDGSTVAEIITNTSVSLDETEETKHGIDQFGYIISQESVQTLHKRSETDFELNADHEHETRDGNPSNVTEKSKDDADSSVNVFSAIPYLKKKRRRT